MLGHSVEAKPFHDDAELLVLELVGHLVDKRRQALHSVGCRNVQLSLEHYAQQVLEAPEQSLVVRADDLLRIKPV